ncbi:MAG TPA: hypothetical protein VGC58_02595 [Candidatus Paceibacterota bacterium]
MKKSQILFLSFCLSIILPFPAFSYVSINSNIATDTTWSNDVYVIENDVSVNSGVTLTIASSTIVKFQSNKALTVSGTLIATGTLASPVYFTSINDDVGGDTNGDGSSTFPNDSDWKYILNLGTTTLSNSIVRYGGYSFGGGTGANIQNTGNTLSFSNSTSTNSTYAIRHTFGTTTATFSHASSTSWAFYLTGDLVGNISSNTIQGDGGVYSQADGTLILSNNSITTIGSSYPIQYSLTNGLIFSGSGNTATGTVRGINLGGTISENQTWTVDGIPYLLSNTTISNGSTVTINPGTIFKFESGSAALTVDGTLLSQGTSGSPIYFTSIKDDVGGDTNGDGSSTSPSSGDWKQIYISSTGSTTISNTIIRYGGNSGGFGSLANLYNVGGVLNFFNSTTTSSSRGVRTDAGTTTAISVYSGSDVGFYCVGASAGTKLSISTSTIVADGDGVNVLNECDLNLNGSTINNIGSGYPVHVDTSSGLLFTHSGNTITGNSPRGYVMTGPLGSDQTWSSDTIPYVIPSSFSIPSGKTLSLTSSTTIKFLDTSSGLSISGNLLALGISRKPIYFTSIKDDSVGGDTNADGSGSYPSYTDWKQIQINSGGNLELYGTKVFYGGNTGGFGSGANIYNVGGALSISTSTVAFGGSYGIYQIDGTVTIDQSSIRDNGSYGIRSL